MWDSLLEQDPHCECKLPHIYVGVESDDLADSSRADRAVDTRTVSLIAFGWNSQRGMIENIERLEIKLALHSFGDREVLNQGRIRHELTRSDERIATDVAELAKRWSGEWPRARAVVG